MENGAIRIRRQKTFKTLLPLWIKEFCKVVKLLSRLTEP